MQFSCRVTGYELKPTKDGDVLIVKLAGGDIKVQLIVDPQDRHAYPLGDRAILEFSVKQTELFNALTKETRGHFDVTEKDQSTIEVRPAS